jgi:ribosome maturation factor RimP
VEGTLKGISGDVVEIEVNGQPVEIERGKIKRANLVFEWKKEKGK